MILGADKEEEGWKTHDTRMHVWWLKCLLKTIKKISFSGEAKGHQSSNINEMGKKHTEMFEDVIKFVAFSEKTRHDVCNEAIIGSAMSMFPGFAKVTNQSVNRGKWPQLLEGWEETKWMSKSQLPSDRHEVCW